MNALLSDQAERERFQRVDDEGKGRIPLDATGSVVYLFAKPDRWMMDVNDVACHATEGQIVVDFSAIERIQSRDLSDLVRLQLRLKHRGARLVFEHAQHQVSEVFTLTRLNRLIEIRDEVVSEASS